MDGKRNCRRYEAGDTIKLETIFRHRANLKEVRLVFVHPRARTAPPLIARGQPHPITGRGTDGSIRSRLAAELTLPRAVVPGIYKLVRISYETGEGRLGHLEKGAGLPDGAEMIFEVYGEPQDTPDIVDIAFVDTWRDGGQITEKAGE